MENMPKEKLSRYFAERKVLIIFAFSVMLLTSIPYLVGFANQDSNWHYTGFAIGLEDGNSYIAKMLSGAAGDWLFRSPYSAEEQRGVIAFLPYLILGKLTSPPGQHDQLVVIFHIFRFFAGFLSILASYDFVSMFIKDIKLKWWAVILIVLGGGSGWILTALQLKDFLGSLPLEFISPESFGFLGILGFPHLAMARALLLWGMVAYLENKSEYTAGLLWLLMGFFQPMVVVIAWLVVVIHIILLLITNRNILKSGQGTLIREIIKMGSPGLKGVLVSCPIVIYTSIVFLIDPYLKGWTVQNNLASPHFVHYLVAFGLYLPLTILGVKKLIDKDRVKGLLIAGWLGVMPFLIYAPVPTQRRLAEGIWVIIVVGLISFFMEKPKLSTIEKGYLCLAFPSTLLILIGSILVTGNSSRPLFRPSGEIKMANYLASHAEINSLVLSAFETGNNLPAWAPVQVLQGHGPETINLKNVIRRINIFFETRTTEAVREKFLKEEDVQYLVWGPIEREQWLWTPEHADYLTQIYNQDGYVIYQFNR